MPREGEPLALLDHLNPLDPEALAAAWAGPAPTHHVCIDGFLRPDFARELAASYPSFEEARKVGRQFQWVNEDEKVQVTDSAHFPEPVLRLHHLLASFELLALLSKISGIPDLVADPELAGGGIHTMGVGGHLDVHVDFNLLQDRRLHRRLNLIVYLSEDWDEAWGGEFELWDPAVKQCLGLFPPAFNRAVMFNTTTESFHGVRGIRCPEGRTRNSFATFYYTKQAPAGWDGQFHNSIYKPRPGEWWKGWVQMPVEDFQRNALKRLRRAKHRLLG